ncbi:DMT family transporter [Patescibacteria group bacterium]|nr:DMT family transporter [Patescibacteria group bacterium]
MDIFYAWIASISSGISPLVVKASSRSLIKNPWLFNLLWIAFGIPFVIALALLRGGGIPTDWLSLFLLAASGALFYSLYTVSLYKIDVTTMGPLFSLRTVFAVILGVMFLHEKISFLGFGLITFIVLMSPFAAYNENLKLKAFFHKYVLVAVIAMVFLALDGYYTNISVAKNGYATTLLWQDILILLLLLPSLKFAKIGKESFSINKLYPFILLGFTHFGYLVTANLAYAHNLALSTVIVSLPLSMIFAYLLSRVFPRFLENHSPKVYFIRFSVAAVMVICAIGLSFI